MEDDFRQRRIDDLTTVINDLENSVAFGIVLRDKQNTVDFCDKNWHLLTLEDKDKLLELKYAKFAAESIVNTIPTYKQELEALQQQEKDSGEGYYEEDQERDDS